MIPQSALGRWKSAAKAWMAKREAQRGKSEHAACATLLGIKAPLIGRVSMDQCCLDVTDVPEVGIGVEVTLPVRRLAVDSSVPRVCVRDPQ
jgi:alanine racemase